MAEPKAAKQMRGYVCEHGSLHIELMDENGEVFATGTLGEENCLVFVETIVGQISSGRGQHCGGLH